MKLKRLLLFLGIILAISCVFILDAIFKNLDTDLGFLAHLRSVLVVLGITLVYLLIASIHKGKQTSLAGRISRIATWSGVFLGVVIVNSILPLGEFESRELQLFPRDYPTILSASLLSLASTILAVIILLNIRELILHKRKRGTRRNFWMLIGSFAIASLSTYGTKPLDSSPFISGFFIVAVFLIIFNSFRLAWIAYLSRREKIYALLYSLSIFFVLLIITVIFQERWFLFKALRYYFYPLQTFLHLTTLLGTVYFGMAFISTLFHLPTAEAFEKKQNEISSLHTLNKLVTQVFDLQQLGETVTTMVTEVCEVSSVWVEVIPTEFPRIAEKEDYLLSFRNISREEIQSILYGSSTSIRLSIISQRKAVLIDDVARDRRSRYFSNLKHIGSLLAIPLLSHDEVIGILYAGKTMDHGFDQDDVDVLSGFADQAAVALENARLIRRSLEKERLQRELLIAQEMQQRLLPQRLPRYEGFELEAISAPALEVGGDYYDVVEIDKSHLGFIIGDVAGKGVGAAFYMAELKGIFQSLGKVHLSPKEFLVKANEAIIGSIDKRSFISVIYGILDVQSGELTIARAGHCPMLYVSSSQTRYIKPTGMGLGMCAGDLFNRSIQEETIRLQRNDLCVFYMDGVTESRSATGDEFGYERLRTLVEQYRDQSAERIREEIIQGVWNYTDAHGYEDDLTVFVMKWKRND